MVSRLTLFITIAASVAMGSTGYAQKPVESDFYELISVHTSKSSQHSRAANWKPAPEDLALEVSGMAVLDDDRVAVTIRKGEIWILTGAFDNPPKDVQYQRFASGLHEPLGLLWHDGSFFTVQRSELTRIVDTTGDDIAISCLDGDLRLADTMRDRARVILDVKSLIQFRIRTNDPLDLLEGDFRDRHRRRDE